MKTRLTKAQVEEKIAERIAESVIKAIDEGKMPWECPWDKSACGLCLPHNVTTQKAYRGGNVWSLLWQGGGSVEFASFKQWAELGRKYAVSLGEWEWSQKDDGTRWKKPTVYYGVEKGSSACTAIYYHRNPYLKEKGLTVKEKVRKAAGEDVFGFSFWIKQHSIFPRHATNIPAPYPLAEWPEPKTFDVCEADLSDAVKEYLMSENIDVREGGSRAYYNPSEDFVGMPPRHAFKKGAGWVHTLTHEAAHSTGHKDRLKREFGFMGDKKYAFEELVAEMAAQILLRTYGIDAETKPTEEGWDENAIEYLRGWGKQFKESPKEFLRAGRLAQNAVDKILLTEWEDWSDPVVVKQGVKA